jgi:Putative DNA-binding domain
MLRKPFLIIDAADINQLVEAKVPESHYLDYKQALPHNHDKSIVDFLTDVVAFANASGGDLIYGIEEEYVDGKPTATPKDFVQLKADNIDEAIRRLDDLIRRWIDPTLSVQMKRIDGLPKGPMLVLRVPPSPMAPHMITKYIKNETGAEFYRRHNGGNHPMNIDEIRAAFRTSEGRFERLRAFRETRVKMIASGSEGVPDLGISAGKIVVHLLPAAAFDIASTAPIDRMPEILKSIYKEPYEWQGGFNFDGYRVIRYLHRRFPQEYLWVFRNAAVEAVWKLDADSTMIPNTFESTAVFRIKRLVKILAVLDVPPPLFVALSLTKVKGCFIQAPPDYSGSHPFEKIDRETLPLPECYLGSTDDLMETTLKLAFDALYQASGYPRSLSYDPDGQWIGIR